VYHSEAGRVEFTLCGIPIRIVPVIREATRTAPGLAAWADADKGVIYAITDATIDQLIQATALMREMTAHAAGKGGRS
jgi:hypothetical protein